MKPLNLTRLTMGAVVIVGLLMFQPLAYFAGAMMIIAGLTGVCLLEKFYVRVLGIPAACRLEQAVKSPNETQGLLATMSAEQVKRAVAEKYSRVALSPEAKCNFPVGRKFAESVGYRAGLLDALPVSISESFTGAGNPQPYVDARSGERVLDLGCGAGLDMYFYAKAVGDSGWVYGLDLSEAMIAKADRNMKALDLNNVQFLCAPADAIPLPDASVDLVTANGIYNLSPDKDAVMREVFRVLKPGGRTVFAEIVLRAPLPEEIRRDINDWFRCIGGALPEPEFLTRLTAAGLADSVVLWRGRNARTGHELAVCVVIRATKPNQTPACEYVI